MNNVDFLDGINNLTSNFIDSLNYVTYFLEENKPRVFYRIFRSRGKKRFSKKIFVYNPVVDLLVDTLYIPSIFLKGRF